MGGEHCGDLAAEIAVQTVADYLLPASSGDFWPFDYDLTLDVFQNRVMNAVRLANRRIWETWQIRKDCAGMGTTISVLFCNENTATIGNIGDSRAYIFRDRQLTALTRDDALVASWVESGKITAQEAKSHPLRSVLTSALGQAEDIAVQLVELTLRTGDRLLISSDGLHGVLDHSMMSRIMEDCDTPMAATQRFVEAAKEMGGPDNISCIVVACM
jgi:protein phosphatase